MPKQTDFDKSALIFKITRQLKKLSIQMENVAKLMRIYTGNRWDNRTYELFWAANVC